MNAFLARWQEFLIWLPVLVVLALGGWIVFGALDPAITGDALAWLLELPVLCAYAAAALAAAWLCKRTYLYDMDTAAEQQLQDRVAAGDDHARWLLTKDRIEWLVLVLVFLLFFWPER